MAKVYPLVTRELSAPIAFITQPIESLGLTSTEKIDTRTFLSHVVAVSKVLKEGKHAINLCTNRYLFMVSFCAVILRGHTNLLPSNKNPSTQEQLSNVYEGSYIIHDGLDLASSIEQIDLSILHLSYEHEMGSYIPTISDKHLACISFTSGSTGKPKPNLKYWRTLHQSSSINYRHMIQNTGTTVFQLATVPAQHMWGLETSILLPLFHQVCVSDAQPLFPQDILDTIKVLPTPVLLVSTPTHLRALTASSPEPVPLSAVLCATSPLTPELAKKVESQFSCPLREIYGCSEVGSIAVRRTALEQEWLRFNGIRFEKSDKKTVVSAAHLPVSTTLQDNIILCSKQRFSLSGRDSDLIKIAGKRGSLLEINQVLLSFEGLIDGVIIHPEPSNASSKTIRLCAVVVLKEGFDKSMLTAFLRERLDNAFVPRPVYIIPSLPRESNSKLLKSKLDKLLRSLRSEAP